MTSPRRTPDLLSQLGGRRGIIDSTVPGVLFVVVFAATQKVTPSAVVAVGGAVVLGVLRLVQRAQVRQAIGGLAGVALCAFVAQRSGSATNYYLPGLLINIGYAAAYTVSILLRWPLLGLVGGGLTGDLTGWRRDPALLRAYSRASWIWVAMFLARLAVQGPLYFADATVALGVTRVAMGLPLFALVGWVSYGIVKRATPTPGPAEVADEAAA